MTQKLKTETFSQKIEYSGGVILLSVTPLFSFVTFHLKQINQDKLDFSDCVRATRDLTPSFIRL